MIRTRSPGKEADIPIAPSLYSLSNKMGNSLLAVRDINHKYIVVERGFLMKIRTIQIWLIFCGVIEVLICSISGGRGYSILQFELIKCVFYFIFYIIFNIIMTIKKWEKDTILRMNGGVSLALSSLSGAIFATFFIKAENGGIGWIIFLIVYIGTLTLFYWMWKKGEVVDEESEKSVGNGRKIIYTTGLLSAIFFGRIASDDAMVIAEWIGLLLLIWLFAFSSLLFFIRCRYDFNKINQNN